MKGVTSYNKSLHVAQGTRKAGWDSAIRREGKQKGVKGVGYGRVGEGQASQITWIFCIFYCSVLLRGSEEESFYNFLYKITPY